MSERVRAYRGYFVVADQPNGAVSIMSRDRLFIRSAKSHDEAMKVIDQWLMR